MGAGIYWAECPVFRFTRAGAIVFEDEIRSPGKSKRPQPELREGPIASLLCSHIAPVITEVIAGSLSSGGEHLTLRSPIKTGLCS